MALLRAVSSTVLVWITTLSIGHAHEVLPAIADMRAADGTVTVEVRTGVESFIAGIDLSRISDTNESEQAERYDELRALGQEALASEFSAFWPDMARHITLLADGVALTPDLISFVAEPVGDVELVRTATFTFAAPLPDGAQTFQMGWAPEFGVLVLRQMDVPQPYDAFLQPGALTDPIPLAGGAETAGLRILLDYIPVGFAHIVPMGLDHILFILALFFFAARTGPLMMQVALFSVAHILTLALAAFGYTRFIDDAVLETLGIPIMTIVEPLIALSIVYIAIDNIFVSGMRRLRPLMVFLFGLLHGFAFAAFLTALGLPESALTPAFFGFTIGVEIGLMSVIAVIFLYVWQALRIDRGANEVGQGFAVYSVLLFIAIGFAALNPSSVAAALQNPVWLFTMPLAAICVLSIASIQFRDQQEAYHRLVAVPASVAIAFTGAYRFVASTLL